VERLHFLVVLGDDVVAGVSGCGLHVDGLQLEVLSAGAALDLVPGFGLSVVPFGLHGTKYFEYK
jgi:hypothetical protein